MSKTLLAHEPLIRLGAFTSILAVMALWEWLSPRRNQEIGRARRWPSNLGVVALDTVVVRLVYPAAAVGTALLAEARGWGLFQALETPAWLAIAASVILLDLAIYFQHVLEVDGEVKHDHRRRDRKPGRRFKCLQKSPARASASSAVPTAAAGKTSRTTTLLRAIMPRLLGQRRRRPIS